MATLGVKTFELTKFGELEAGYIFPYKEDASQSFKRMDPVVLESGSGQVQIAVETAGFLGLAWQDASGTENTELLVLVVTPQMIFSCSVSNDGAAQATALTQVGIRYGYKKSSVTGSTTLTTVDVNDTTNDNWEVIGLDPRDPVGDTNGRVLVRAVPAKLIAVGS
jgi:hypothetical protein